MNSTAQHDAQGRKLLYIVNVSWFFVSHRLLHGVSARSVGYDVHVATRVTSVFDGERIREANLTLHDIPMGRGDTGPVYDFMSLIHLFRLLRRLRPDIVHLVGMKPLVLGGLASRLLRIPFLVVAIPGLGTAFTAIGPFARIRRALIVRLLRMSIRRTRVRLIFQNVHDLETFVRLNIASREYSRLVRGSGVQLSKFAPTEEPAGALRILLAARMLRSKGVLEFVEAARQLSASFPDAQFLLAGDIDAANPDSLRREDLPSTVSTGPVKWLGHVEDMSTLLSSCHIVCLPTFYGEGVPRVLIEAAASGRPLVTTSIPGCDDICVDGLNGLLIRPRSIDALVDALGRLMRNPAQRRSFGQAGRKRVETHFSLELVVRRLLEVYEEFDNTY